MPSITVKQGSRKFHLQWEIVHQDKRCRRYKIWPIKNPDLFIVLENNEPLIRGQLKLKHRRIDWKQVEGPTRSQATIDQIIKEIEKPSADQNDNAGPVRFKGKNVRKSNPYDVRTLGEKGKKDNEK